MAIICKAISGSLIRSNSEQTTLYLQLRESLVLLVHRREDDRVGVGSIGFIVATEDARESSCRGNVFGATVTLPGTWSASWGYRDGFARRFKMLELAASAVSLAMLAWGPGFSSRLPWGCGPWILAVPFPAVALILLLVPEFRCGRIGC